MDPFSIVVGVGSLIEMSLQLSKYLNNVHEAAASFEGEMESLMREIQGLESVNKSIEQLHKAETGMYTFGQPDLPRRELEVWENTAKALKECSSTVQALQSVIEGLTGKSGVKVIGLRDGIKKRLRKQSKDGELNQLRVKLSSHRESLNVLLTLLSLEVLHGCENGLF